jgi:hypothetical protein
LQPFSHPKKGSLPAGKAGTFTHSGGLDFNLRIACNLSAEI